MQTSRPRRRRYRPRLRDRRLPTAPLTERSAVWVAPGAVHRWDDIAGVAGHVVLFIPTVPVTRATRELVASPDPVVHWRIPDADWPFVDAARNHLLLEASAPPRGISTELPRSALRTPHQAPATARRNTIHTSGLPTVPVRRRSALPGTPRRRLLRPSSGLRAPHPLQSGAAGHRPHGKGVHRRPDRPGSQTAPRPRPPHLDRLRPHARIPRRVQLLSVLPEGDRHAPGAWQATVAVA